VIENKQSSEIADSAILMISMTYDQRRETFRFVSRKIRFVFALSSSPTGETQWLPLFLVLGASDRRGG
jgi:hypothetical protein